jgi:hypothetical protein
MDHDLDSHGHPSRSIPPLSSTNPSIIAPYPPYPAAMVVPLNARATIIGIVIILPVALGCALRAFLKNIRSMSDAQQKLRTRDRSMAPHFTLRPLDSRTLRTSDVSHTPSTLLPTTIPKPAVRRWIQQGRPHYRDLLIGCSHPMVLHRTAARFMFLMNTRVP